MSEPKLNERKRHIELFTRRRRSSCNRKLWRGSCHQGFIVKRTV
ncbi:unnamed protein product [Brassica oleracea]